LAQRCSAPHVSRAPPPPPHLVCRRRTAPAHHPPSPFRAARPKSSHMARFRFWPNPLPGSHFAKRAAPPPPPSPHTTTTTYAPSPVAVSHGAPKPTTTARFQDLAKTPPCLAFRSAQPHPCRHLIHTTTHPSTSSPSPFCTVHPKSSHDGSVFGFEPKPPLPPRVCKRNAPPPSTTSCSSPCYLNALSPFRFTRRAEMSPSGLGFGFLVFN